MDEKYMLHLRIPPQARFQDQDILTYSPNLPLEPSPYEGDGDDLCAVDASATGASAECNAPITNTTHSSSVFCWWDCQPFEGQVYRLPIAMQDDTMRSVGYFCSPACAAAYNLECGHRYGSNKWHHMELLQHMHGKTTPAPPRECLSHFGGNWPLTQFRQTTGPVRTLYPPIYLIKPNYEVCSDYEKLHKYVPIDPGKVAIAEKQLKLSRSEGKQHRENMSLDMFIKCG